MNDDGDDADARETSASTSDGDAATGTTAQPTEDAGDDHEKPTSDAPETGADDATENDAAVDGEGTANGTPADRVAAAADDEALAGAVRDLQSRAADLEAERDDLQKRVEELESTLKRNQADFQNYKKRAKKKQAQIRERATEDFVERVVTVRDNLVRALEQDEDADIREGVESTLREFDRVLDAENVATIDPDAGEDVDPHRHEVMMRVESDHPPGTVADVYQQGYEMAEKVIKPAQVTVSTGESDEE